MAPPPPPPPSHATLAAGRLLRLGFKAATAPEKNAIAVNKFGPTTTIRLPRRLPAGVLEEKNRYAALRAHGLVQDSVEEDDDADAAAEDGVILDAGAADAVVHPIYPEHGQIAPVPGEDAAVVDE